VAIAVRTRQACCVIVSHFKEEIETLHSIAQVGGASQSMIYEIDRLLDPPPPGIASHLKEEIETHHAQVGVGGAS
jgi:hypothetical protein